jgi:hypothetical protein
MLLKPLNLGLRLLCLHVSIVSWPFLRFLRARH